jgi:uncharacterized protein YjbI with pentapeptide repeats
VRVQSVLKDKLAQRLIIGGILAILLAFSLRLYVRWFQGLSGDLSKAEAREWTIGLLLPTVVIGGIYFLNSQANRRSEEQKRKIEQAIQEHRQQLDLVSRQHQHLFVQTQQERREQLDRATAERKDEREHIEREGQYAREQAEFKFYLDRMSALIVDANIGTMSIEDDVFRLAQALTAHILRAVGKERRNQVIFFLRSLNLTAIDTDEHPAANSILSAIQLDEAELIELRAPSTNFKKADLRRANLRGAMLRGANFDEAYLDGANLLGAYLENTHLYGANFYAAHLEGVYFNGANLAGANLQKAYLVGANLVGANLVGANLAGANLSRANLIGANIEGANFEQVTFGNTTMQDGSIQ